MTIKLISGIYHSLELLPHFVKYYSSLGINYFLFHHNTEFFTSHEISKHIKKLGVKAKLLEWHGSYNYRQQHFWRLQMHQRYVTESDWIVIADLDEFIEFQPTVHDFINMCENQDCNWILGEFVDRVSESGKLIPVDPEEDIFRQFPHESEISRKILLAPYKRTAAVKGGYFPKHNCYEYDSEFKDGLKKGHIRCCPKILKIHHFKWREGVVEILKQRLLNYRTLSLSNPKDYTEPFKQCERFLEFYDENHHIPVLNKDLKRFRLS